MGVAALAAVLAGCGDVGQKAPGDRVLVVGVDGRPPRQVADRRELHSFVAWSPDGALLAWQALGTKITAPAELALELAAADGRGRQHVGMSTGGGVPSGVAGGRARGLGWSPDGRLAALGGNGALVIVRRDGSVVRRARVPDIQPDVAWSPDGSRLAFVETRRGTGATPSAVSTLVISDAHGSVVRRIGAGGEIGSALSWSPDGRQIAFSASSKSPPRAMAIPAAAGSPPPPAQPQLELHVAAPARGDVRRLTKTRAEELDPAWRPNGDEILVRRREGQREALWLFRSDGARATTPLLAGAGHTSAEWSPDGRRVLAAATGGDRPAGLYVIDADGGRVRRLAAEPAAGIAAWSPQGEAIAFAGFGPGPSRGTLWLARVDGRAPRTLARLEGEDIHEVVWAPRGDALALVARRTPRD